MAAPPAPVPCLARSCHPSTCAFFLHGLPFSRFPVVLAIRKHDRQHNRIPSAISCHRWQREAWKTESCSIQLFLLCCVSGFMIHNTTVLHLPPKRWQMEDGIMFYPVIPVVVCIIDHDRQHTRTPSDAPDGWRRILSTVFVPQSPRVGFLTRMFSAQFLRSLVPGPCNVHDLF